MGSPVDSSPKEQAPSASISRMTQAFDIPSAYLAAFTSQVFLRPCSVPSTGPNSMMTKAPTLQIRQKGVSLSGTKGKAQNMSHWTQRQTHLHFLPPLVPSTIRRLRQHFSPLMLLLQYATNTFSTIPSSTAAVALTNLNYSLPMRTSTSRTRKNGRTRQR